MVVPSPQDTVVALSSPPGGSPRAVVRLSGARTWELARGVFAPLPARGWRGAEGALTLPGWPPAPASVLVFRGPRSYTGEDLVELWVPGAPPLVRCLLRVLTERGARLADRGEFTRRAFLSGRLDLTQVEAVLTLTTSEDARAARGALRALAGGLGAAIERVKGGLVDVLAHVEAAIDFSEEELDLTGEVALAARLDALAGDLDALLGAGVGAPQAGTEPVVALRGPANAGKSTLFNALVGRPAALVADVAGTTRDVVAGTWRLPGGRAVRLLDTAGAKPAAGALEGRALAAAEEAARGADLVLWVSEHEPPPGLGGALWVRSKSDLRAGLGSERAVSVSARTGAGLDNLAAAVAARFAGDAGAATDLLGSARQEGLLVEARAALARAAEVLRGDDPARAELAAVDLGEGLEALGALTGEVTRDDVLGRIFASFCVGK